MEVYTDDIIIMSMQDAKHGRDYRMTLEILQRYGMRLNPKKHIFGVWQAKFLGFMISNRGIEANPDKVKVVLDMRPPRNVKEVQRLIGCIAALGCFMLKSVDKCQPFFRALLKHTHFACHQEVRQCLSITKNLPCLHAQDS